MPQRERDCAHRDAAALRLRTVANALRTEQTTVATVPAFAGTTRSRPANGYFAAASRMSRGVAP
jgi:hypothetical protein